MITACLVERVYFCSDLYNSMRENKLISSVRTTSFKKIVSYLASNKANLGGDIYVGTEFAIGLGCLPPFSPVHDKTDLVRLDVLRVIIIKSGWCDLSSTLRSIVAGLVTFYSSTGVLLLKRML